MPKNAQLWEKKRKERREGELAAIRLSFLLSLDLPLPRAAESEVAGYIRTNFNRAKSS